MKKAAVPILVAVILLTVAVVTEAQQPGKVPLVGVLAAPSASFFSTRIGAFRQGLREFGYLEGKNISIEYRYAEGKLDRLPDLAAELVHLKVDVILTASEFGVLAAKNATRTIPIVFGVTEDAVASGLVSSLARPGGNATGLTVLAADLGGKDWNCSRNLSPGLPGWASSGRPVARGGTCLSQSWRLRPRR